MESLASIFSSSNFMPHGHCFLWTPSLLWLNVISDSLIALSYLTIPFTLIYFIRKRQDLPFDWMFGAFGVFILACGGTHVLDMWTIWNPDYWLSGFMKGLTAAASVPTAILLAGLVPKALLIPSPKQLELANTDLRNEIRERKRMEEELQRKNVELAQANQAKDAFLANVSHELRTPLTLILAPLEQLAAAG